MPRLELTKHSTGQWKKKIGRKVYYFGTDYAEAVKRYHSMMVGQPRLVVRPPSGGMTVSHLVGLWMATQRSRVDQGLIRPVTLSQYGEVCDLIVHLLDGGDRLVSSLRPTDFSVWLNRVSAIWGLCRRKTFVTNVRSIFRWGHDNGLCDMPRFGTEFVPPPSSLFREVRRGTDRVMSGDTIRRLLAASTYYLYPAVLLGINGGMGNNDVAQLTWSDIRDGVVDVLRPKTRVRRVIPLWPETLASLPKRASGPILRTRRGTALGRSSGSDPLAMACINACRGIDLDNSFYDLRHTFRTVADSFPDVAAVDLVMGHETRTTAGVYYVGERDVDRCRAVVEHVRRTLWPDGRGPVG